MLSISIASLISGVTGKKDMVNVVFFYVSCILSPVVPGFFFVLGTVDLAHNFLLLHSMQADVDVSSPWWCRLGEILASASQDVADPIEKLEVAVIRIVLAIVKMLALLKMFINRRLDRPMEEGGILLA